MFTAWKPCISQYPADGLERGKDESYSTVTLILYPLMSKRQKTRENCGQPPNTLDIHGAY